MQLIIDHYVVFAGLKGMLKYHPHDLHLKEDGVHFENCTEDEWFAANAIETYWHKAVTYAQRRDEDYINELEAS